MNNTLTRRIRTVLLVPVIAALVAFNLAACASTEPPAPAVDAEAPQVSAPKQTPPPQNHFIKQFGDVITWSDGVSISVSSPSPFEPTELAAGNDPSKQSIVFQVVVTNNSSEPVDPMFFSGLSANGEASSAIFDIDNPMVSVGMTPTTMILPGSTATWYEGYAVTSTDELVFQMSYSFLEDDAVFTNVPF